MKITSRSTSKQTSMHEIRKAVTEAYLLALGQGGKPLYLASVQKCQHGDLFQMILTFEPIKVRVEAADANDR